MEEFPQIVKAITGTPWLILPESLETILEIVNTKLNGEGYTDEEIRIRLDAAKADKETNPRVEVGGGVGIISLYGPIFPRANLMTMISGATSLETFSNDFRELLADDSVKQIVMDINSPGGASDLVHETGVMIREARDQKPVYAVANTVAGSAALWLMSQATKAYATPSGKVGSLGVYTIHEDISAQDANEGRKITIVSSGEYKTALSPHEPLSDKARAYLQETVDELKTEFVNEVATGRGLDPAYVSETFGNAKMFSPKKAADINMVDGVMSMNDLLGSLVAGNTKTQTATATSVLQQHVNKAHALFSKEGGLLVDGSQIANVVTNLNGGELALKPEQLAELKAALGITGGDDTDDTFVEKAKEVFAEHTTLQNSVSLASAEKQFAEQNPVMYAEHQKLLEKDRTNEAKAFASGVSMIKSQVGDKKEDTKMGLSALALETVASSHVKFAKGEGTLADFEAAITAITDGGTVKFGENGSSLAPAEDTIDTSSKTGLAAARQAFAAKVVEVQATYAKEHSGAQLDYLKALSIAAEQNPELAAAYQLSSTT